MRSDELITNPHPFLEGMEPEHLRLLSELAMRANFAEQEVIFRQGEPADRFYLIQAGSVFITSRIPERGQTTIQIIGSGEPLGWSWLFEPYTWHFDAFADEPTQALYFHASSASRKMRTRPEAGLRTHETRQPCGNSPAPSHPLEVAAGVRGGRR